MSIQYPGISKAALERIFTRAAFNYLILPCIYLRGDIIYNNSCRIGAYRASGIGY